MTRNLAIQRAQALIDSGAFADVLARRVRYATESEEPDTAAEALQTYLDAEMVPALALLGSAL